MTTPNLGLSLPTGTDQINTDIQNMAQNFTTIDNQFGILSGVVGAYVENFKIQVPEVDDTARIQRAIGSITKGIIMFAGKQYNISSRIKVEKAGITLQGAGRDVTIINNTGTDISIEMGITGSRADSGGIYNMTIQGNASSSHGVVLEGSFTPIMLTRITGHGGYGLVLNRAWTNNVLLNDIKNNSLGGVQLNDETNNVLFSGNEVQWNNGHGIEIYGCRNNRIIANGIENNLKRGIHMMGSGAQANRSNQIFANYFEANCRDGVTQEDIYVDRNGNEISSLKIDGNYFDGGGALGIHIVNINSAKVSNNNAKVTLGWEGYNVDTDNQTNIDYSGVDNSQLSAYVSKNNTDGLLIEGRQTGIKLKRNNAGTPVDLFHAKTTGNVDFVEVYVNGYQKFNPISASNVPNVSMFVDSADNKLKFKDSSGTVNLLY